MFNIELVDGLTTPREWVPIGDFTFNLRPATDDHYVCSKVVVSQKYRSRVTLRSSDTWLNIGAHIGAFALQVHQVGGKVFCFEPELGNYELLEQNVEFNKMPWQSSAPVLFQTALTARPDRFLTLMLNKYAGKSSHSLAFPRNRRPVRVANLPVSVAIRQLRPDCIKISAPGVEHELITGIPGMQWRNIRTFVVDWHLGVKRDKPRYEHAIDLLKQRFSKVSYVPFESISARRNASLIVAIKE